MLPCYFPDTLQQQSKSLQIAANEILFHLNDKVEWLYYLQSGEVKAVRYLPDGTEVVMLRAVSGELLGESTLIATHYICSAVALADSVIIKIPMQVLKKSLANDADFSFQFMLALAKSARVQCSRYERLRLKNAGDRVVHYLLCESDENNVVQYSRQLYEWAHELGLQKETLYRTLKKLEKEGRIKRHKRQIKLVL